MRKLFSSIFVSVILLVLASCSHVRNTADYNKIDITNGTGNAQATLISANYGLYLFACVPIATGDSLNPGNPAFFTDKVKVDEAFQALVKESKSMGAKETLNVSSDVQWKAVPIGFGLLWIKEVQVSGNAIR